MALREPWGEQEVERPVYHFGCPVSEDGLRTLVEQADAVKDIEGDDGVLREFHDIREVGLKEWEIRSLVGPGRSPLDPLGAWPSHLQNVPNALGHRGHAGAEDTHEHLKNAGVDSRR
jgi:hypothetical protein